MRKHWFYFVLIGFILLTLGAYVFENRSRKLVYTNGLLENLSFDSISLKSDKLLSKDHNDNPSAALHFNGVNDYLVCDSLNVNIETDFTFSFWIKSERPRANQTLFLKGENCPDGNQDFKGLAYEIVINDQGLLVMRLVAPNGNHSDERLELTSKEPLPDNEWCFVTITFDNRQKQFNFFLNAEAESFNVISKSNNENFSKIYQTQSPLKIGADENYCGYVHKFESFFKGSLDNVSVFGRVLDHNEILLLAGKNSKIWQFFLIVSLLIVLMSFIIFGYQRGFLKYHIYKSPLFYRVTFSVLTAILYYVLFSSECKFSDTAYFGGDTWEYQSMAVNFAKGHGVQRFGEMETFEVYKFDHSDSTLRQAFRQEADWFNDYRTPLYPLFVGGIYKLSDIKPKLVKKIQLFLLVVIASLLPWIGYYYWQQKGFLSGVIGGFIYLLQYHSIAENILTESFFSFMLALIVISAILHEKFKNSFTAICLGVTLGLGLLTKGQIIFLPFIILAYFFIQYFKTKEKRILSNSIVCVVAIILTLAPWSLYASVTSKKFIILSTQAKTVLLDCNNEKSVDGDWHPEWRLSQDSKAYFYNNDGLSDAPATYRVVNFYSRNFSIIPLVLKNKMLRGFGAFIFLYVTIICYFIIRVIKSFREKTAGLGTDVCLYATIFLITTILLSNFYFQAYNEIFSFIKLGLVLAFLFILIIKPVQPLIFTALFLNFVLITLISFGEPRYISVIDFIFILCGVYGILKVLDIGRPVREIN